MRSMWAVEIVEPLPYCQFLFEIHVVAVAEQLIELVLVGSMRPLDLAVELRSTWLDVDMLHAQVCDMPMEERPSRGWLAI